MAPPIDKRGSILAKTNFPVYTVNALGPRHFLLGGGGGKSKTGVPNVLEIYSIDGSKSASKVATVDMGPHAVQPHTCTILGEGRHHSIAVAQDETVQVYNLIIHQKQRDNTQHAQSTEATQQPKEGLQSEDGLRQRRKAEGEKIFEESQQVNSKSSSNSADCTNEASADVENEPNSPWAVSLDKCESISVKFKSSEEFHKVLRFSPDGSYLLSGGSDGIIRMWKIPVVSLLKEFKAHKHDVDDISIAPSGEQFTSISRGDSQCIVWNAKNASEIMQLKWAPEGSSIEYRFRQCRYGLIEATPSSRGKPPGSRLYSIHSPGKMPKSKDRTPCYIVRWDTQRYMARQAVSTGEDHLSELTVSDDGRFLSVATMSGSVSIFVAFNLTRVLHVPQSHSIFVTGLSHLPCGASTLRVTGQYDTSLLSIAPDNTVKLYHVPVRSTLSLVTVLVLFVVSLLIAYFILDYVGL